MGGAVQALEEKALGIRAFENEQYEQALEHFSRAISFYPEDYTFYSNRYARLASLDRCRRRVWQGRRSQTWISRWRMLMLVGGGGRSCWCCVWGRCSCVTFMKLNRLDEALTDANRVVILNPLWPKVPSAVCAGGASGGVDVVDL